VSLFLIALFDSHLILSAYFECRFGFVISFSSTFLGSPFVLLLLAFDSSFIS
jgi:hypothetical protein